MEVNKIIRLFELSKIQYTLEELEDMNRDMESIMKLMDSIKDAEPSHVCEPRKGSNIYQLRPDQITPSMDIPDSGMYFQIPRIIE